MADTYTGSGVTVEQWNASFFEEYVRYNPFKPYIGTSENSVIQTDEMLAREPGEAVTFNLIRTPRGTGVTGNQTLEGNEEALDNRSFRVAVNPLRHAITMSKWEMQKSPIMRPRSARTQLRNWAANRDRDDIVTALGSINGVNYAAATEVQKDAWLVDNADRVLFGAARSNNSSNDHSASLANIDNTADKLTTTTVSLMKEMALDADPKIMPIKVEALNGEEWFVLFVGSRLFRDLSQGAAMQQANREAWIRGEDNPLFTGQDLMWDGVIIKRVPEITPIVGVGASGIDVAPAYFCGAQAVCFAWGQRWSSTTDVRDYGFKNGVGIECMRGVRKSIFGKGAADTDDTVQHGLVTGYFAAVASA